MHAATLFEVFPIASAATAVVGAYFLWVAAFERLVEPVVRRSIGFALRCPIVWAVAGPVRVWAPASPCDAAREAAVTAFGSALVLSSALVPAMGIGWATGNGRLDPALAAAASLMVVPMVAVYLARLMMPRT